MTNTPWTYGFLIAGIVLTVFATVWGAVKDPDHATLIYAFGGGIASLIAAQFNKVTIMNEQNTKVSTLQDSVADVAHKMNHLLDARVTAAEDTGGMKERARQDARDVIKDTHETQVPASRPQGNIDQNPNPLPPRPPRGRT